MAKSFSDRVVDVLERVFTAHINLLFPVPKKPKSFVDLSRLSIQEATTKPETEMAVQVANIEVFGDAAFGGYFVSGIVATNRAGHPRIPQPANEAWSGATSDVSNLTRIRRLSDGRWFLHVDDTRAAGDTVTLTVSSDPGDDDDAVINVTYVTDRVGPIDFSGMQVVEATEAPEPEAA